MRKLFRNPYIGFSALFFGVALAVFAPCWLTGGVLIDNSSDAAVQHFPAFVYYGEYLREVLRTLFLERSVELPAWDMSLGLGGDIVTVLHYYVLGDPFNLLSGFFPAAYADIGYSLVAVLRLYCAGLGVIAFFRHWGCSAFSAVLGGLAYAFSGFAIGPGVFHPFFALPMIWFPLILLGMERILEGKKPLLFSVAVAMAAVSSFYFFYMLVLLTVLYGILRFFMIRKGLIRRFLQILAGAVAGVLIACPVLLPNLMAILRSDRLAAEHTAEWFYPENYYALFPANLISNHNQYYSFVAVAAPVLLAVLVLFVMKKQGWLKGILAILLAFACLPAAGSAFNGFTYATNRWIWALILALCFTFAYVMDRITEPDAERLKAVTVVAGIYAGLCLLPWEAKVLRTELAVLFLLAGVALLWLRRKAFFRPAMAGLVVAAVLANGLAWTTDRIDRYVPQGDAYRAYLEDGTRAGNAEGRFDNAADAAKYYNSAMVGNTNGTNYYFSTTTAGTDAFRKSMQLNSAMSQQYKGLDGRSYLAAALGVTRFVADEKSKAPRPYGFDREVSDGVYGSDTAVPLVYAFDTAAAPPSSVEERQQALLQFAMVEEETGLPAATPTYTHREVEATLRSLVGAVEIEGGLRTAIENAVVILEADVRAGEELYFITDLDARLRENATRSQVGFYCGEVVNQTELLTAEDNFYCGLHSFAVNLGSAETHRDRIMLVFTEPGEYYFDATRIVAQPMTDFETQAAALADSGIADIAVETNRISFRSARTAAGMACVAIPYQEGWSVTVDGEKATLYTVQGGLCGVIVPQGEHRVVLHYRNPYSTAAGLLFLLGVGLVSLAQIHRRSGKRRKQAKEDTEPAAILHPDSAC